MGTQLKIIRNDGSPISVVNLAAAVSAFPDLTFLDEEASGPRVCISLPDGLATNLYLSEGELIADTAGADAIAAMLRLAGKLEARVRNEDLLTYKTPYETYKYPKDLEVIERRESEFHRRRYRRNLGDLFKSFFFQAVASVVSCMLLVLAILATDRCSPDKKRPDPSAVMLSPSMAADVLSNAGKDALPADVIILPAEDFNHAYARHLADELAQITDLKVKASLPVPLEAVKPFEGTTQFDGVALMEEADETVHNLRRNYGRGVVIILTSRDINSPDRSVNFLFALRSNLNGVSIVSAARLEGVPRKKLDQRLIKFLLRSVGEQLYQLPRSTDPSNLMYSPIMSVRDVDRIDARWPQRPAR